MKDSTNLPDSIDKAKFTVVRKGYDKDEVRHYLQDLESAFRDLETWSKKAKVQLAEAEERMSMSRAEADGSVDNAMFAVFDAKDRILEKARRRAEQIETEALEQAEEIKARAARLGGESGSDEVLAAAREEAQEILARAKRDAGKVGGEDVSALQREMVQKDQQLSSMRDQLVASRTDGPVGDSPAGEIVADAQAIADQILAEAQERAERIVAAAEATSATDSGGDAAAAAILEAAKAQASEIEARAQQLRVTAEQVLADAEVKYAAAKEAMDVAEGSRPTSGAGASGFANISDESLLAGMAAELREVHDQVESRRAELAELHNLVDERRSELTEVHDMVEERRAELTLVHDSVEGRKAELAEVDGEVNSRRVELREAFDAAEAQKAEERQAAARLATVRAELESAGTDSLGATDAERVQILADAQAEAAQIMALANEEAGQVREEAMRLLAESEQERAELAAIGGSDEPGSSEADQEKIAELEGLIGELRETIEKDKRQARAWAEVVDEMKAQIAQLNADIDSKDASLAAVPAVDDRSEELESRVAALASQLETTEAAATERVSAFESQIAELSSQLEDARSSAAGQVAGFEAQVADLSGQLAAKTSEIDAKSVESAEQVAHLESQVAELANQLATKDAELEDNAGEAAEQAAQFESQLAQLTSQIQTQRTDHEAVVADVQQETAALAARLAELHDQAEENRRALESAKGQAARVEPLSKELTKVQVALAAKEAELVEAGGLIAKAASLAERVGVLESQLTEATAAAATIPMLQAQVDGLKVRAETAEEAAELATSQLGDIVRTVEEAETNAIRRAAAAEAARIREITEDSLGIAHAATAGTGLDADDYVAPEPVDVIVNSDPDDWSDVFGAADAFMARRKAAAATQIKPIEEITAVHHEESASEPFEAPTVDLEEPPVEGSAQGPAGAEDVVDVLVLDEPLLSEPVVDEPVMDEPVKMDEPVMEQPTIDGSVEMSLDEPLVAEPAVDEPVAHEPAIEQPAAYDSLEVSTDEATDEVLEATDAVEEQGDPTAFASQTVEVSYDESVAVVDAEDLTEEIEVGPLQQLAVDGDDGDDAPVVNAYDAETTEPVAAIEGDDLSYPLPVAVEVPRSFTPEPVADQSEFDAFVAAPIEPIFAEAAVVAEADDASDDSAVVAPAELAEVTAADMSERLRLARAELEAELHPGTLPAENIGAAEAADYAEGNAESDASDDDEGATSGLIKRKAGETRYARQSAKLPRIAESVADEDNENISSLSGFRARMLRSKSKDND